MRNYSQIVFHQSFDYADGRLHCDEVPLAEIVAEVGTPVYIYSLKRALHNLRRIQAAFGGMRAHIHYSAKANANLALLRALIGAGAGVDCVSGGEIYRALKAGAQPAQIVFAGVGKTPEELAYAVEQRVGWINVENEAELPLLDALAQRHGLRVRVALRLNPDVAANTHRHIATGHGGAKFGLSAAAASGILARQTDYANLDFAGIHVHIGSQLGDTDATTAAVRAALAVIAPYPHLRTVDVGGGIPVPYSADDDMPSAEAFAEALRPLLQDYEVIVEPGRAVIADAGLLAARVLYIKEDEGVCFAILDAGMTELIRPALYEARHEVLPFMQPGGNTDLHYQIVGPVCESADVLARDVSLPPLKPGDLVGLMTAGAYGMVMASNYNARPRPAEVVIAEDGQTWRVARRRETWGELTAAEE